MRPGRSDDPRARTPRAATLPRIEPLPLRVDGFLSRHADSATGWASAIAGLCLRARSDCLQVARKVSAVAGLVGG
ncbi:hypothetical protein [Nocardia sp. NPDC052112]|uniref:hypothetical protein n=1 Tax=Nocardia sp. NPDC052112 TaxID=3155646 RepID=UPI00343EAA77